MKKILGIVLLVAITSFFTACLKENHSVRFQNNYSLTLYDVYVGTASLGTVGAGSVTGYQSINTGNFDITGTTSAGQKLSGSGSLSGKGKHKWTVTLSSSGTVSIAEDK